jgi:site-specific recombinase XerD
MYASGMALTILASLGPLRDSWLLHLRAEHKSEKTRRSYGDSVSMFLSFLDDPPAELDAEMAQALEAAQRVRTPADIDAVHVRAFIAHLLSVHKPSTASTRYNGLQQWFRWLVDEEEIKYSPMSNLRPPALPEAPPPVVPPENILAVLATCKARTFINFRDEAIIRLLCDTGIRLAEVAGLQVSSDDAQVVPHIDLEQQLVWVMGKGRRLRGVSFGAKTTLALDRYLRARAKRKQAFRPELWLNERERGRLTHWGIAQMIDRRCDQARVPHIHPHQFRHTWAHQFKLAGGDRGDLKRMGGWKSDQMVDRYGASAADERARSAHKKISFGDQL